MVTAVLVAGLLYLTPFNPFPSLSAPLDAPSGGGPEIPPPAVSPVQERNIRKALHGMRMSSVSSGSRDSSGSHAVPSSMVEASAQVHPHVFESRTPVLNIPCVRMQSGRCVRRALDGFYAALWGHRKVRVALWSDSLMAGGLVWHSFALRLKRLLGDGGPGFVQPWKFHDWERNPFCSLSVHGRWYARSILRGALARREYGFGGVNLLATGAGEELSFVSKVPVDSIMIHVVISPDGGRLRVEAGSCIRHISTSGVRKTSLISIRCNTYVRRVTIVTEGGRPVRLLGVYLERSGDSGLVLDGAGVTGARFTHLESVSREVRKTALQARKYALLIYSFGRNEVDTGISHDYADRVRSVLERDRDISGAACLVLGPTDQSEKKGGRFRTRPGVVRVDEALRRAATEAGCAYIDLRELMGGEASSYKWYKNKLMWADLQHLTPKGGRHLGQLIYVTLMSPLSSGSAGGK